MEFVEHNSDISGIHKKDTCECGIRTYRLLTFNIFGVTTEVPICTKCTEKLAGLARNEIGEPCLPSMEAEGNGVGRINRFTSLICRLKTR